MVAYSLWLNLVHPGRYLPSNPTIYLGYDKVEREAVGWADKRPRYLTFMDPFDWIGLGSIPPGLRDLKRLKRDIEPRCPPSEHGS